MVEGAPPGTTWVCARCEQPYDHRAPSNRRPDAQRVRVGVCPGCDRIVKNLIAQRGPRSPLATDVQRMTASGNVRELRPYRRGGFGGFDTRPADD